MKNLIEPIIKKRPIIQCITNSVTMNDCANVLLAVGASPTMAHHIMEVEEIQTGCHGLLCNFGATDDYEAMIKAAETASKYEHPIIVDPVGCGGSSFRRDHFIKLAKTGKISCIRGNATEIIALDQNTNTVTGVDFRQSIVIGDMDIENSVVSLAKKISCIVIASGAIDIISDGISVVKVSAGDPLMKMITGSGCMSSALLAAFFSVYGNTIETADKCCTFIGRCGEDAAEYTRSVHGGTLTFRTAFIDSISKYIIYE